mgnify:CR=1 FL=1
MLQPRGRASAAEYLDNLLGRPQAEIPAEKTMSTPWPMAKRLT